MDIDVLRVSGKAEWKRLDELTRTRNLSGEEIDELEEASALRDVAHMPARVKCAVLGWHTLDEALKKEEQGA